MRYVIRCCFDHVALAQWWADIFGATSTTHPSGFSSVTGIPGAPFTDLDFATVPERKTIKNLSVVKVDAEQNIILIKGSIPGPNGGYVLIRKKA